MYAKHILPINLKIRDIIILSWVYIIKTSYNLLNQYIVLTYINY